MDAEDELDHLSNVCADLVSLTRLEPALVHLFRERPAGAWVSVRELYGRAEADATSVPDSLSAAWLPATAGDAEFSVVSFYDADWKWSLSAVYNTARLFKSKSTTPSAAVV